MYYIISIETQQILESYPRCPDPQEQADYFQCPIYIIEGEHAGLTAYPRQDEKARMED